MIIINYSLSITLFEKVTENISTSRPSRSSNNFPYHGKHLFAFLPRVLVFNIFNQYNITDLIKFTYTVHHFLSSNIT